MTYTLNSLIRSCQLFYKDETGILNMHRARVLVNSIHKNQTKTSSSHCININAFVGRWLIFQFSKCSFRDSDKDKNK